MVIDSLEALDRGGFVIFKPRSQNWNTYSSICEGLCLSHFFELRDVISFFTLS